MGQSRQTLVLTAILLAALFLILAAADANDPQCPLKFPKWFSCVVANYESLSVV
jgi:hypothetical protein